MDAAEFLDSERLFVADTSAWWRMLKLPPDVGTLVRQAIRDDRMLMTPVARMEILYSARTAAEYAELDDRISKLRMLRNDRAVADAAMAALDDLAARNDGYHRVPVTDALIAAAAAEHGGVAVMHKDRLSDRLAEVLAFESVALPVD